MGRGLFRQLLALALLGAAALASAQVASLRMVADNSLAAPMATYVGADRAALGGGIVKDFAELLAAELKLALRLTAVPTRRTGLLLASGEADILCFYSPVWLAEPDAPSQRRFVWTSSLVEDKDVLIQLARDPAARSLPELEGRRIGAIRGYVYPELQRLVDAGRVVRDDTHTIDSNLAKLNAGRLFGAIVNEVNFRFLRKTAPALTAGLQQTLTVSSAVLACAVSRQSTLQFERIEAAVRALVKRGAVQRIYAKYE